MTLKDEKLDFKYEAQNILEDDIEEPPKAHLDNVATGVSTKNVSAFEHRIIEDVSDMTLTPIEERSQCSKSFAYSRKMSNVDP